MGVEVAGACFHWSQPLLPPQINASVSSSSSSRRRRGHQSPFLGTTSVGLPRARSLKLLKGEGGLGLGRRRRDQDQDQDQALRRAISAGFESFGVDHDDDDDDEFVRRLEELAIRLGHEPSSNDFNVESIDGDGEDEEDTERSGRGQDASFSLSSSEPPWPDLVPANIERKANSMELPLSLRLIKRRKKRWEEDLKEVGESACCSVKKAFSSMVFIIRELQSYTLQMRELLFLENLQGVLSRVQGDMNASFVWLFQHIFSCTPTLMLSLMLLLANFTVYSMGHSAAAAAAAAASPNPTSHSVITVKETKQQQQQSKFFNPSAIKSFSVDGRTASIGGNDGGGRGKVRPVAGATDDGSSSSYRNRAAEIIPQGISTAPATTSGEGEGGEGTAAVVTEEEDETRVWNSIVEETLRMQAAGRDDALMDQDILQRFVSPVTVEVEPDDQSAYFQTELMYHQTLSQDPNNALLLTNFAQFLYIVLHDHDRAEYYFKRAIGTEPVEAETLSRYANFLWLARKDLGAAEETYLEAIAADPGNTFHAANYAHFLWSTGGEDTCYPLDAGDDV